jgi:hypothetical protein
MLIERRNVEKFAALFKAGTRPRQRREHKRVKLPSPTRTKDHSYDETIPAGTRLYKSQREREIDAIAYENRRLKRYLEIKQSRLDRLASQVPAARRYCKTLRHLEPTVRAVAYRDVDVDLAGLAKSLGLRSAVERDYDRFALFECAVEMVDRVARRAGITEHDSATYFASGVEPTALDELKRELALR